MPKTTYRSHQFPPWMGRHVWTVLLVPPKTFLKFVYEVSTASTFQSVHTATTCLHFPTHHSHPKPSPTEAVACSTMSWARLKRERNCGGSVTLRSRIGSG